MKFEIRLSKGIQGTGKLRTFFYFILKANNNEILVTSEMYESKQSCKKGISAVRKCLFAPVVDNSDKLTT